MGDDPAEASAIDGGSGPALADGSGTVTGRSLADSLRAIESSSPLVQHLTNEVTMNDVANVTLYWGALPVMSDTFGDAQEMVEGASAVLINIGRATPQEIETMHEVGRKANGLGVPVVLDPVGAGATPTRRQAAESLLEAVDFAAIKGNYGEIGTLAGVEAEVKGVESIGEYDEIEETARALAESTGAVVVASGAEDVVAGPGATCRVTGGHELMGRVVGTGCMLGATLAAFCGADRDGESGPAEPFTACLHGTLAFDIAGEHAAELDHNGPASYRINFLDSTAGLGPDVAERLEIQGRIDRVD